MSHRSQNLAEVASDRALVLYDGVCGLCNRATRFALPRDRNDRLMFAPLQSELARAILERHGKPKDVLDTFYLVVDQGTPNERLYERSRAVLKVLLAIGGGWGLLALALWIVPTFVLDALYNFIARRRYAWFGKSDRCMIPRPEWKHKFLGESE